MYKKITLFFLAAFWLLPFSTAHAVILIDLNDFYVDPSVVVASDGSSATIYEDSSLITVLLSNDPGMGDPGIDVPAVGLVSLNFDYAFSEGSGNDDDFYAWVFDPDTYTMIDEFLILATWVMFKSSNLG